MLAIVDRVRRDDRVVPRHTRLPVRVRRLPVPQARLQLAHAAMLTTGTSRQRVDFRRSTSRSMSASVSGRSKYAPIAGQRDEESAHEPNPDEPRIPVARVPRPRAQVLEPAVRLLVLRDHPDRREHEHPEQVDREVPLEPPDVLKVLDGELSESALSSWLRTTSAGVSDVTRPFSETVFSENGRVTSETPAEVDSEPRRQCAPRVHESTWRTSGRVKRHLWSTCSGCSCSRRSG